MIKYLFSCESCSWFQISSFVTENESQQSMQGKEKIYDGFLLDVLSMGLFIAGSLLSLLVVDKILFTTIPMMVCWGALVIVIFVRILVFYFFSRGDYDTKGYRSTMANESLQ